MAIQGREEGACGCHPSSWSMWGFTPQFMTDDDYSDRRQHTTVKHCASKRLVLLAPLVATHITFSTKGPDDDRTTRGGGRTGVSIHGDESTMGGHHKDPWLISAHGAS